MTEDWLDNIIKGRIAETIVREMFRKAGFVVFPYGVENSLTTLTEPPYQIPTKGKTKYNMAKYDQTDKDLFLSDTIERIRCMPDFLTIRKRVNVSSYKHSGNLHVADDYNFIEVKYRSKNYFKCSDEYAHFMTGVHLILVTPENPYFHTTVIYPKDVRDKYKEGWADKGHRCLDHTKMISLKGSHTFPEFEDFNFKPYIKMVKKYLDVK